MNSVFDNMSQSHFSINEQKVSRPSEWKIVPFFFVDMSKLTGHTQQVHSLQNLNCSKQADRRILEVNLRLLLQIGPYLTVLGTPFWT